MSTMAQSPVAIAPRAHWSRATKASLTGAVASVLPIVAGFMGWILLEGSTLHANDVPMWFLTDGFDAADSGFTIAQALWVLGGLGLVFSLLIGLMPQGAGRVVAVVGSIVVGVLVVAIPFASAMHIGYAEARHLEIIAGRSLLALSGPGMWLSYVSGVAIACAPLFLVEGRRRTRTQA